MSLVALVSLLYLGGHALVSPTLAFANPNCTGQTDRFDGTNIPSYDSWGTLARLVVGEADLCSNPNNGEQNHISQWSMVQSSTYTCYLAESGYRRTINVDYWLEFEEYENNGCNGYTEHSFGNGLSVGYTFNASVYYDNSTKREVMSTSDGYTSSTGYDPYGTWGAHWKPEWEGEVLDGQDTMPGTSTSPAYFYGLNVQNQYQNTTWSDPSSFSLSAGQGCYWKLDSDDFYIYHAGSC